MSEWSKFARPFSVPVVVKVDDSIGVLVNYFKSKMTQPACIWSLPSEMMPLTSSSSLAVVPYVADLPSLAAELCEAVKAKLVAAAPVCDNHVFFQVVDANPENRKLVRPAHKPIRKSRISIRISEKATFDVGQSQVCCLRRHEREAELDLSLLASVPVMTSLVPWPAVEFDVSLVMPSVGRDALQRLEALLQVTNHVPEEIAEGVQLANSGGWSFLRDGCALVDKLVLHEFQRG